MMAAIRRGALLAAAGAAGAGYGLAAGAQNEAYDRFGGWTEFRRRATGYFRAESISGRWWLVSPEGGAFLTKGVCHASYTGDNAPALGYAPYGRAMQTKYGSAAAWARATAQRLRSWGLNTVGAWSSSELNGEGMAYAPILGIGASFARDAWLTGGFPDVFDPAFMRSAEAIARRECAPRKDDPWVLGYFTDNELRWGPDWRSKDCLLDTFLQMAAGSPGRAAADAFMKRRRRTEPNDNDKAAFLEKVAAAYFRQCREAIRKADPHHMVLGCRFAGYAPTSVLRGLRRYVDVVSYNDYSNTTPVRNLDRVHRLTRLPIMVTEFSFKAMDSGLPNTRGAGLPVKTQQERAERYEKYVRGLAELPYWVGYHWFEFCDEPKEGRFDGENSNYGLVRIDDTPWELLTARFTSLNGDLEALKRPGPSKH